MKNLVVGLLVSFSLWGCGGENQDTRCDPETGTTAGCEDGEDGGETTTETATGSYASDFFSANYNDNGTADPSDDTMTFVGGDFDGPNDYTRDPANDRAGMLAFRNRFDDQFVTYLALYGTTNSGEMVVFLNATGDYAGTGDYLAAFNRIQAPNLPVTGNADYVGNYAGAITNASGGGITLTEGVLSMSAEFNENMRVTGVIFITGSTNMSPDFDPEVPDQLVLNESTMDGTGILEGGTVTAYDNQGSVVGSGTYIGAIGGPNASEVAGAIDVTHGGGREFGVFTGACVQPTPEFVCDP